LIISSTAAADLSLGNNLTKSDLNKYLKAEMQKNIYMYVQTDSLLRKFLSSSLRLRLKFSVKYLSEETLNDGCSYSDSYSGGGGSSSSSSSSINSCQVITIIICHNLNAQT
jgi:hypothetical protein